MLPMSVLSAVLYATKGTKRKKLSLLSRLQLFFSDCTAISDTGGNVHHSLIAVSEAMVTLPLLDKSMK